MGSIHLEERLCQQLLVHHIDQRHRALADRNGPALVSKDVRSHLLSHGLGGVQNQHYDRHTYWPEKRQALKKWAAYLAKLKGGKMADAVESKDP